MYEKEKQIIQFLLKKIPSGLTKTQLIKAIYLADYESKCYTGKQVSSFEYVRYDYGPYDFNYPAVIEEEITSGKLQEIQFTSQQSRKGCRYISKIHLDNFDLLTPIDRYLLKYVAKIIEENKGKPIESILDKVYATEPVKEAEYLNKLDMDKLNNSKSDSWDGISLAQIALSEYEYEQGHYITLEELWSELQNCDPPKS